MKTTLIISDATMRKVRHEATRRQTTIYTRDSDFNRFPFLDTVDPVAEYRRTTALKPPPRRRTRA